MTDKEITTNLYKYLMDLMAKYDNFLELIDVINFDFEVGYLSHNIFKIIHYCEGYKFTIRMIRMIDDFDVRIFCRKVLEF